jgi:hypothetical protein
MIFEKGKSNKITRLTNVPKELYFPFLSLSKEKEKISVSRWALREIFTHWKVRNSLLKPV